MLNSLVELDRDHLVHPALSWSSHEARGATVLASAKGAYVTDSEGRTLIDGFAGLWCVNVGYGQESVVEAATEQMRRLPYATGYFHFSSEPAILLAAKLAELAPGDLNHVYFTLGGSDAVDSANRLIRYYYNVTGRPAKKATISLDRGYHGSSGVGAGVTGLSLFHTNFDLPLPSQHHIPAPYVYRSPTGNPADVIADAVAALKAKVEELGAENVAAFFCEPVQGSGGVIVPPEGWLRAMRDTCRDLDILFVADEVITGFGRTGPLFACEHEDVVPDLMTIAKGLTSGYSPMGAVLMSDSFYRAIADNTAKGAAVGHGTTYSAHPVSAAVGVAVMRLYETGVLANGQKVAPLFAERLRALGDHPLVGDVRVKGLLAAVELVTDKAAKTRPDAALRLPDHLARIGYENGVLFRAFGDGIAGFAPPLICSEDDITILMDRFGRTLDQLLVVPEVRAAVK